ncbi:MAG: hypothetical protein RL186_319 [Pseudomonadota bacterium]
MPFDLRAESWIPFRRKSGTVEYLPPWAITEGGDGDDPIVALAAPRPDFNGALHELLIGMFSVALALPDEKAWRSICKNPPTPEALREALMALPPAFNLDGDGPRFLQDFDVSAFESVKPTAIENLLIDAAGENTQKLNKDLFVKRDRVSCMGRAGAAMALFTLQAYAPSGGQGHRTSLRGGGPLTTLVDPRPDPSQPLWSLIAANLILAAGDAELPEDWSAAGSAGLAAVIWPWLAPTRTSNPKVGGGQTTQSQAHPMQALFGMPRRIRLDFEARSGICDVLALPDAAMVASYRAINFGVDYGSGLWLHPLSPHYKSGNQFLPVHPQPDGLGWKDWAGLVLNQTGPKGTEQRVAEIVSRFSKPGMGRFDLRVFGYDMDNMKARGWVDVTLPDLGVANVSPEVREAMAGAASKMVEATRQVANMTVGAVKAALFARAEDAKGDFSHIKADVWAGLEHDFNERLCAASLRGTENALDITSGFEKALRATAIDVFEAYVDLDALDVLDSKRVVAALHGLKLTLSGKGKSGEAIFALLRGVDVAAKAKTKKGVGV